MRTKAKVNSQTTCYVIAYDIPDDKRRTKVHKLLSGFGKWTQYSLFECFLTKKAGSLALKADRAPGSRARQRAFLSIMRQLPGQSRNSRWAAAS